MRTDLDWPLSVVVDRDVWTAAAALHDEAHADDRTTFRYCMRQTCRDLLFAFDMHCCERYEE